MISVVVPHLKSRDEFFYSKCLPSIELNNPREIFLMDDDSGVQEKRNAGARRATSEFLFFCDDDIVLPEGFFTRMLDGIGSYDFAYCDYDAVNHPTKGFAGHRARHFDAAILRKMNYISTMSLVRRSAFPGFDVSLPRLQDWDLWLTMVANGSRGVYIRDLKFTAHWLDEGITKSGGWEAAQEMVKRKHGL